MMSRTHQTTNLILSNDLFRTQEKFRVGDITSVSIVARIQRIIWPFAAGNISCMSADQIRGWRCVILLRLE